MTEAKREAQRARRRLQKAIAVAVVGLGAVAWGVLAYRDETKRPWRLDWSVNAWVSRMKMLAGTAPPQSEEASVPGTTSAQMMCTSKLDCTS